MEARAGVFKSEPKWTIDLQVDNTRAGAVWRELSGERTPGESIDLNATGD
ncbi:MAG TPA: hypothetical protein VEW46_09405 [Pyrinomonadaceae bacterium]|nr:hypothetical protein [Pyrinomonadaceae bacterium]